MARGARHSISELHRRWADLENECHRLGGAIALAKEAGIDATLLRDRQARLLLEISSVVAEIRDAPATSLLDYLALLDVAIEHEIDLSIDMACYGPSDFPMFTRLLRGLARAHGPGVRVQLAAPVAVPAGPVRAVHGRG
jgi:hypothetical protein